MYLSLDLIKYILYYEMYMDTFQALADPTRRTIIELIAKNGNLSASDIYGKFKVSHPAVSQHLKVLRVTNILQVEKKAQQRIYKINTQSLQEFENWISKMKSYWNERFDVLDEVLKNEKKKYYKFNPPAGGKKLYGKNK